MVLGFVAALLGLDRLLDRLVGYAGGGGFEAERSFGRLARERRGDALRRRLGLRASCAAELRYLPLETGWAAVAARRPLGLQTVEVASIVGTVDPHKAVLFDGNFRPPAFSRGRWTLLFQAMRQGARLPPIAVHRVGAEHFVGDGHHRVSVARALGLRAIDAEVLELERTAEPHPPTGG